ncbi:uncharacterized protein [Euwallacea fornicatus]|uniref:uncharacterized protein n=1 Tax=Euwallacea fornicatus TaxID=995702 RepID=UPI00338D4B8E
MPPATAKDIIVILLDLKMKCRASAFCAFTQVILYEQLSDSKNLYKVFLVNTAQSANDSGYDGIARFNVDHDIASVLQEIMAVETGPADPLKALQIGVNELKEWLGKPGVMTLRLLFITDLSSFETPSQSSKLLNQLIEDIVEADIFISIVGPAINPPKIITSDKDVKKWMTTFIVPEQDDALAKMKLIVENTPHSVICNYTVGLNLFYSLKYHKGMQPWQVPLSFGTLLHLPASTIRVTKRQPPFALKDSFPRNFQNKWIIEEEQDKIIDERDTISGIIKYGKFVKIETDGRFKVQGPRSFQVLLISEKKYLPEYFFQSDGSYLVLPDQGQSLGYLQFFHALVDELIELDMCIIARRVFNKDLNPKFVALIPRSDFNIKGFILCNLPYADDIAHIYTEEDINLAPKVDVNKTLYDFLNSINVQHEKCQVKVPLAPTMMVYSTAFDIINKVIEKLVQDDLKLKETVCDESGINLDDLKSKWPIRLSEEPNKEEAAIDFDDVSDFNFD